jgi:NADH-quinone oxidoreductase subunit L
MGGLKKYMPFTYWTFAAATAAIIGLPLTSGFFSKDEILFKAFTNMAQMPEGAMSLVRAQVRARTHETGDALEAAVKSAVFQAPPWLGTVLYVVGVLAATMTAFYMVRMFILTFHGEFRGWTVGRPSVLAKQELEAKEDEDDEHAHDDDGEHHHEDLSAPGYAPHESPWQMTVPLIILAAFAVLAGILNPGFHIFEKLFHAEAAPMEHWLHPVFKAVMEEGVKVKEGAEHMEWTLALGGISAFAVGTGLAYWMYIAQNGEPAKQLAKAQPGFYRLLLDKWRIDELYDATIVAAVDSLAETAASFDKWVVDGIIAKLSSLVVAASGTVLRAFQNGVVHVYAAMMVVGLAFIGWFFAMPHPEATITEQGGDYVVTAGPGMGYSYKWDANNDGQWDPPQKDATQVKVTVEPGKSQTVRLEVTNAFGLSRTKSFTVTRPEKPQELGAL